MNGPREGYVFAGWYKGATKWEFNVNRIPASDIELIAKWELKVVNPPTVPTDSENPTPPPVDPEQPSNPDPDKTEVPIPMPINPTPEENPKENTTNSNNNNNQAFNTNSIINNDCIKTSNGTCISKSNVETIAKQNPDIKLHVDTMTGRAVQARVYINASDIEKFKHLINLQVWTEESKTFVTKSKFEKWFTNKVEVVNINHKGTLGGNIRIAAKVNLDNLDINNLVFYIYDKESNTVNRIKEPNYRIDRNGYIHFWSNYGGDIIITDNKLLKK